MLPFFHPYRRRLLFALLSVVPLGFASKFYRGPLHSWVNDSLAGVWYEVFWILAAAFFLPRLRPGWISRLVFSATCVLEALQLWHPPFLETIRSTFVGRTIFGTSFAWSDFPYYAAGCLTGWLVLTAWGKRQGFITLPGRTAGKIKTPDRL